jgi:hypothetical protein
MAFVLKTPVVTIDGDDFSDHFSEVTIETTRDEVDVTAFGAVYKQTLAGLADATMTFMAFQNFASNELHQNMFPISQSDTPVTITVKPTSSAVSATNPKFTMSGLLYTYNPLAGTIGEASTTELTFRNAGQSGIVQSFT